MARDIFISHSAQDKAVADAVCATLEAATLRCWVAPRDVRPGHSFAGEITRAIRQSKVMVLIFSGHSNKSEQVLREVQVATDCHLPIVRFRIEDVALTDDLTYFLISPHWLDALTPPLSKHIATLEIAVKELLGQSVEDACKSTVSSAVPPVESTPKKVREIVAEKSSNRWKLPAIATAAILGATITLILLWQPARPGINRYESTPSPTSPLARPTEPTQSPTSQPARTAELTPVFTPTPKHITAASQPNNARPAPRNNRRWEEWINDFVHDFVASDESNDLDLGVSFYSPSVDLYEEGLKTIDSVRHDIETYKARWPTRHATIRGDVRRSEKVPARTYAASFQQDYYAENPASGEWVKGTVEVDLEIAIFEGIPRISSIKQKAVRRETSAPTAVFPTPSPLAEQTSTADGDPRLIRVTNTRYAFSALVPQNVFPNPQTSFSTDRQTFTSPDSQTTLALFVQPNDSSHRLRESYEKWATTQRGVVDYKVLRDDWFVVSGEKSGRGFYVKAVAKRDILAFMYFECDENHYPVSKETLTAMSKSFNGN